jgi:hypothetical protein
MSGRRCFAYAPDTITLHRRHLSAGARFDMPDLPEREIGSSPRSGARHELGDTLMLRGSRNHRVMRPPVESILGSGSGRACVTGTVACDGPGARVMRWAGRPDRREYSPATEVLLKYIFV